MSQGSHLGPLLFIIVVNDLHGTYSQFSENDMKNITNHFYLETPTILNIKTLLFY